jgi:hypothetical protein
VDRDRVEAVAEQRSGTSLPHGALDRKRRTAARDEDRVGRAAVRKSRTVGEDDGNQPAKDGGDQGDEGDGSGAHDDLTVARRLLAAVSTGKDRA